MSSLKRFEWAKKKPGHRSGSELESRWGSSLEDSIDRPVVSAFLMAELGSFKVTMVPISQSSCAVWEKSRVKGIKISMWDQTVVS